MVTGAHDASELPLRFVALGRSLVSDLGNPVATSARAILAELAAAGHDVTFLEQRNGPAMTELLRARGAEPYRAVIRRYPRIQFRTYDLPRGWERTVWFGREIGTADAVIALPGTPESLLPEIAANESPHLVRLVDDSFGDLPGSIRLTRAGGDGLAFGPAVRAVSFGSARNDVPLILAYDDTDAALLAAAALASERPDRIATGTAGLSDWPYLPEVELPERYARHRRVLVAGAGHDEWALARQLLPLASGAELIDPPPDLTGVDTLPDRFDASTQATAIATAVRAALLRARAN